MTGCTLSQILYQVSTQRPVIVKGEGGNAKVIVGLMVIIPIYMILPLRQQPLWE